MRSFLSTLIITALLSLAPAQAHPQGNEAQQSTDNNSISVTTQKTASTKTTTTTTTTACNNSPQLCNRNYNNITHMGAHDSAFLRDISTGFSTSGNQFYNVTVALSAGIRLLQAQVHDYNGSLELCHTSCLLLDGGSLESFLTEIKSWMDSNPNEVVTLLLVNSDKKSPATFGSVFSSSGIDTYGYVPTSTTKPIATWPTLQSLITSKKRLVTFIASIDYDSTYPYLLPEFTYIFETYFGVLSLDAFNCTLQRPTSIDSASTAVSSHYMGLINHFADTAQSFGITVPDVGNITTTNSKDTTTVGALGTHANQCKDEWGVNPTFLLVDFFNVGPSIETADILNGIMGKTSGRVDVSTSVLMDTSGASTSGSSSGSGSGSGSSSSSSSGSGSSTVSSSGSNPSQVRWRNRDIIWVMIGVVTAGTSFY